MFAEPEHYSASRWALDDIYRMLPVLQKSSFTSLLALCDAQLALPGSLTADPASPGSVLKWLSLAGRIQRQELLQVLRDKAHTPNPYLKPQSPKPPNVCLLLQICKAKVDVLAGEPGGLSRLCRRCRTPKVMEDLEAGGQAEVAASIEAPCRTARITTRMAAGTFSAGARCVPAGMYSASTASTARRARASTGHDEIHLDPGSTYTGKYSTSTASTTARATQTVQVVRMIHLDTGSAGCTSWYRLSRSSLAGGGWEGEMGDQPLHSSAGSGSVDEHQVVHTPIMPP